MAIGFHMNIHSPNEPLKIDSGTYERARNISEFKERLASLNPTYWDIPGYEYGCLCFSFGNELSIFTIWNI